MRTLPLAGLAGSLILLALTAGAQAAGRTADPVRGGNPVVSLIPATGAPIRLEIDKGTLVHLSRPASTVFVADPNIADVQVKSPNLIYISAKAPGETVIYAVDADDNVLLNAPIQVELNLSGLRQSLRQVLPGQDITVTSVNGNLILGGVVGNAAQADKARELAAVIAGVVKGAHVVNRMTVVTPNQVNLRVKIAEVDTNVLKQIGVDWRKLGGGEVTFSTANTPTPITNQIRIGKTVGQAVSAMVSALETEGFLTVLAEPDLTAMNGQTASFLAGGEFPVPIAQSFGTAGVPTITVEFKQFGVQLAFTPTVLDSTHLNLRVRPEVSQLSTQGEVNISGFVIPALTVRRADTTVELGSGQTFALAGLLQHTSEQDISKVPWLGDIPILGALFRSNKFQHNQTELVILVTPYLVTPSSTPLTTPMAGLQLPNDAQQVLWSDVYRQKLPGAASTPVGAGGTGLIGSAGFRLN